MAEFLQAQELLRAFKGQRYRHGMGVLPTVGEATASLGKRAAMVASCFAGSDPYLATVRGALATAGVELCGVVDGPGVNAPVEDLMRITGSLRELRADVLISFGGGSTIDATKAAAVLLALGGDVEPYFGTGLVSRALAASGKELLPHVAIQTAASSAAHLTKYSNITDLETGQKKLIVDDAIVPVQPIFDYSVTLGAPASLTADGALDGLSHCLEVLYGAVGKDHYEQIERVAHEGIRLVIEYLPRALARPDDVEAREALGLATDLGGYAIMLGGTNGAHLTSFSLVDILSHGRACALMNPYYTVFFAPAIERPLRLVGRLYKDAGYTDAAVDQLSGRDLGLAVARAMINFEQSVNFPVTLKEIPGFSSAHVERALTAAKNPQLKMKLENMPVPLSAEQIDEYMGPVLNAAQTGDLDIIKNV